MHSHRLTDWTPSAPPFGVLVSRAVAIEGLQYKRVLADIDERMIKATALVAEWRAKILQAQPSPPHPSCTVAPVC